jgi:hypothetical protein
MLLLLQQKEESCNPRPSQGADVVTHSVVDDDGKVALQQQHNNKNPVHRSV